MDSGNNRQHSGCSEYGRLRHSTPGLLIGYMRVSKTDGSQVVDLQRDALLAEGIAEDKLYSDTASGTNDDRPGLEACVKALREGDTLVIWKLDRLGRNLRHLVNIIHDLTGRSVGLRVLTGQGAAIDTTTPAGRLHFRHFRFPRRVRAGVDRGAHPGRTCVCSCSWPQGRAQAKDDTG